MYTPFDFNEAINHKKEFCEDRLREGSPVVGVAYNEGLLLLTVRRTQRKVYEIYDRHMFSAVGNQSDIENLRLSSINLAHQEGFERSPDDVTMQRLVGFAMSPALKKAFGDQFTMPFVVRAVFAELGRSVGGDNFVTLNYDGEYRQLRNVAVVAGSQTAEDRMLERLGDVDGTWTREAAVQAALSAWAIGARIALRPRNEGQRRDEEELLNPLRDLDEADADRVFLRDELKGSVLEVGLLERRTNREGRFRLLSAEELSAATRDSY